MKLMTREIEDKIPALYEQDGKGDDAIVYAHYFCIANGWDWYATEYDRNDRLFFGLVKGFETEYGYFSLDEFEETNKHYGFPVIERDMYWKPRTIAELG